MGGGVRRKDEKQNVALAIHLLCRGLQCCCKPFDSRTAACFGIESYDNWVTPETAPDDMRSAGCLAPKNALIAEETERHHGHLVRALGRTHCRKHRRKSQKDDREGRAEPADQRF